MGVAVRFNVGYGALVARKPQHGIVCEKFLSFDVGHGALVARIPQHGIVCKSVREFCFVVCSFVSQQCMIQTSWFL